MAAAGSSFFTLPDRPRRERGGSGASSVVVWLWGEHDASTDRALCLTLARAIALDTAGLILDLSGVEFLGPSTLVIILRARAYLGERSTSLTLRSPSAVAGDIIDACGLSDLLGPELETAAGPKGKALGSWVAVPAVERSEARPGPSAPVPDHVPARIGGPDQKPENAGSRRD